MRERVKKRETMRKNMIILQYFLEGSIWVKEYYNSKAIVMPLQEIMKPFENKDIFYIASIGYP